MRKIWNVELCRFSGLPLLLFLGGGSALLGGGCSFLGDLLAGAFRASWSCQLISALLRARCDGWSGLLRGTDEVLDARSGRGARHDEGMEGIEDCVLSSNCGEYENLLRDKQSGMNIWKSWLLSLPKHSSRNRQLKELPPRSDCGKFVSILSMN